MCWRRLWSETYCPCAAAKPPLRCRQTAPLQDVVEETVECEMEDDDWPRYEELEMTQVWVCVRAWLECL